MQSISITPVQTVSVVSTALVPVDSNPTWSTDNAAVATAAQAPHPNTSGFHGLTSGHANGIATITCTSSYQGVPVSQSLVVIVDDTPPTMTFAFATPKP